MCYIPDSREESCDLVIAVVNGLELIDHHLRVFCSQVLAVLYPHDGGLSPVPGDVYGAVELSLRFH